MKRPKDIEGITKFFADLKKFDYDYVKLGELYDVVPATIEAWEEKLSNYGDVEVDIEEIESYKNMDFEELHEWAVNSPKDIPISVATVKLPRSVLIVCMSDAHLGSKYTDYQRWKEDIELIASNKNILALFNGDLIDYEVGGPRDLADEQIFASPQITKEYAKKSITQIKDSLIAMTTGCHDNWNRTDPFVMSLKESTLTGIVTLDRVKLKLMFPNVDYTIDMRHKMRGSSQYNRSYGIYANASRHGDFDVGFDAHVHVPAVGVQLIKGKPVIAVSGGTYKGLDGYGRRNGFDPSPMHIPGLYLDAEKKRIIPFMDWRDGIRYISENES